MKTVDFSETIEACDLKVGKCRQLIDFMKVCIHVISPYFGGSSLYFDYFCENLPMKIFRISYISYISPYLEFQISLPKFKNSLLCLIILPIWKRKSPYLSSGMYHMSGYVSIEGQGHYLTLAQGRVHTKIQTRFSQKLLGHSKPNFV